MLRSRCGARFLFAKQLRIGARPATPVCSVILCGLGIGLAQAKRITLAAEDNIYADEIIFARDTRYQHIVLTRFKDDIRLFLSSHLQFSSRDEYRYHEALVHPGLSAIPAPRRVLVLGGGDGLAVREILKYPQIESITLVDLDPEMTRLFSTHPMLTALNQKSFSSPKVHIINADAFPWVDANTDSFDFIVIDFPDPTNYSLGKLYTTAFYKAAARHLSAQGLMVVQSTSPMFARDSYWCIAETLKQAGLQTYPYHVYVPSFGEWGFVIAAFRDYQTPRHAASGTPVCERGRLARAVSVPAGYVAVADATQPAERSGAGSRLRSGLEGHQSLKTSRRKFLQSTSAALVGLSIKADRAIAGSFVNDSFQMGHQLRDHVTFPQPKRIEKHAVVIVGGGIAGLSSAWRLNKKGFDDFVLLEMNEQAGGNSRWGENEITAYPWAAHYVPIPGPKAIYVRELFEELGVLRNGQWEERYLCFSSAGTLVSLRKMAGRN